MSDITKMIIGLVLAALIIIVFFPKVSKEGFYNTMFNNAEGCKIQSKTHKIVVKTMDAIPLLGTDTRANINNGINYRDMQTRDIVLGDDKTNWCTDIEEEERNKILTAIGDSLDTDVQLFDGGDIMDKAEAQSVADGIVYIGKDKSVTDYVSA